MRSVTTIFGVLTLLAAAASQPLLGQTSASSEKMHTHGLFLGVGASQMTLESDELAPPDEGRLGVAGRIGYGFGDLIALVITGDLSRMDLTFDAQDSEFELAHIALGARIHPFRAWRLGPFIEGGWLRYAATTDRALPPATTSSRVTLEGTGASATAGLHLFLSRAVSLEASAAWTDGKLTKSTGSAADADFTAIPLRSRLYRLGLTWWLGT
ncbi:MAG TPA: hypothetical protein VGQ52_05745 [Gemmatimonadaceae bacterium]|nr:hypothetical protein [Gemmatimonadaceae bacterium]